MSQPCLRCGFCCKQGLCSYGEPDPHGQCVHLQPAEKLEGVVLYSCARYEEIKERERDCRYPMFGGGGCSSTLFNEDRDNVAAALDGARQKQQEV